MQSYTNINSHRCIQTYRPVQKSPEMYKMYTHSNNTHTYTLAHRFVHVDIYRFTHTQMYTGVQRWTHMHIKIHVHVHPQKHVYILPVPHVELHPQEVCVCTYLSLSHNPGLYAL